ncbi:MBL fold metallo-hydrolase [Microbacterium deminutum]|uniref:Metallo-beta-lactamase domain-containing protein n=1 Tax=Microbacterium deminutum TaxID=344164 RepID=A0ABP5CJT3_9MICO
MSNPRSIRVSEQGQAVAPPTEVLGGDAFDSSAAGTALYWLGMAGFLINSRGTLVMVDPVLRDFDMPLLIDLPADTPDVPRLDAILVTHADNDHFSIPTCRELVAVTGEFHSTSYVAEMMTEHGIPGTGHGIGDRFSVGQLTVEVLPADHAWQNENPEPGQRTFRDEDSCGFWITTPDGTIWAPGDSRLIREHHLTMPSPTAMLFDFSDSEWHFGFDGAVEMANAYPDTQLLLHHWGSVDSPDFAPFNGNPQDLFDVIVNPDRIRVLAPGEAFPLATNHV